MPETITVGGEVFNIVGEDLIEGLYGNRYRDACERERELHKDDPCPDELKKTETLEYKGWKCKIFYNYVPSYSYGMIPTNAWFANAVSDDGGWNWNPGGLSEEVKTLEDAVKIIEPGFKAAVDRMVKQ